MCAVEREKKKARRLSNVEVFTVQINLLLSKAEQACCLSGDLNHPTCYRQRCQMAKGGVPMR